MPDTALDQPPVALVTGAARGIGAATARALAEDGWAVVATDACADDPALGYHLGSPEDLEATVAACGDRAIGVIADVRDEAALEAAVATARHELGGLDAAVAVAGVLAGGVPTWETSDEMWNVQLDVNLTGTFRLARVSVPALLERPAPRRGRFVAVSSAAGVRGLPMLAAYSASKHGVIGLVRSMAAELGPQGICANVVCPGSTDTPILAASAAVYGLASPQDFAQHHLLPRLLEPHEVATVIAFLCGPGGSGITGTVIPVDAGMDAS